MNKIRLFAPTLLSFVKTWQQPMKVQHLSNYLVCLCFLGNNILLFELENVTFRNRNIFFRFTNKYFGTCEGVSKKITFNSQNTKISYFVSVSLTAIVGQAIKATQWVLGFAKEKKSR